jgi:hypothetical protein
VNTGKDISKYYYGTRKVNDTVADGLAIAQDWLAYMGSGWLSEYSKKIRDQICKGKPCENTTRKNIMRERVLHIFSL